MTETKFDPKNLKLPMGIPEIEQCIPHRYPFLLIDRIVECEPFKYIKGYKNISGCEPVLQGHFPGNPVVPGVFMVEAMAQASAVLGKLSAHEACTTCLLMEIDKTRFRRMVRPGDVLELHVEIERQRGNFFWFKGEARVDNEVAASAHFSAKLS